jgi:hypothetical protein
MPSLVLDSGEEELLVLDSRAVLRLARLLLLFLDSLAVLRLARLLLLFLDSGLARLPLLVLESGCSEQEDSLVLQSFPPNLVWKRWLNP